MLKDYGWTENNKELIRHILKYNEYWFEIVYNRRECFNEIVEEFKSIGYYLFKVNKNYFDLILTGQLVEYKNYKFQKIESIDDGFCGIRKIKDFVV